jgi:hypothetical protein
MALTCIDPGLASADVAWRLWLWNPPSHFGSRRNVVTASGEQLATDRPALTAFFAFPLVSECRRRLPVMAGSGDWEVEFYADDAGREPCRRWMQKLLPTKRIALEVAIQLVLARRGPAVVETEFCKA